MIASIRNNPDPALPRTLAPEAVQDERANVRAELFQHLAGLVLVPTVNVLSSRGVLRLLEKAPGWLPFSEIMDYCLANPGYLRVALRVLVAAGWLRQRSLGTITEYSLPLEGRIALEAAPTRYADMSSFLENAASTPFAAPFRELVVQAENGWGPTIRMIQW